MSVVDFAEWQAGKILTNVREKLCKVEDGENIQEKNRWFMKAAFQFENTAQKQNSYMQYRVRPNYIRVKKRTVACKES